MWGRRRSTERGSLGIRFTTVGDDYQLLFARASTAPTRTGDVPVVAPHKVAAPPPEARSPSNPGLAAARQSERRRRKRVKTPLNNLSD